MSLALTRYALALFGALSSPALAQHQCVVPDILPEARATFPPPGSAVSGPITGYQLVLSWTPQFCRVDGDKEKHAARCGAQKFGFNLVALRADGEGRHNPVYCKRMGPVPAEVARRSWCAIPSVPAMSHAWAKYGSCIADDPARYFEAATKAFDSFKSPDMSALARAEGDVAAFKAALVAANPGTRAESFAVGLTPLGWLEELRLCLDTGYSPRPCAADAGGAGDGAKMRIWPRR